MTPADLSERELWALLIGEYVIRFAATTPAMRHVNPTSTTMYVGADTSTVDGVALAATKDFIDWCSGRDATGFAEQRFRAFCASIGETPTAAIHRLTSAEAAA